MNLFDAACSVPWLMDEPSLRGLLAVADRQHDPGWLVEARKGGRVSGARLIEDRSGVAVLTINGPIFRHADLFAELCGGATTARIAAEFTQAIESADFHSVLLNIDSPGGEAAGIEELASMIRERRGAKPIVAYVESTGASAAYWIASAADEIVVGKTAFVGSIGAVMTYRDNTAAKQRAGINEIEFVSAVSPNKRPDMSAPEGRAVVQARVDDLGSAFVDAVAANRGVTRTKVLDDFGKGGVLMGRAAVKAGLADRVGTFEKTLKGLVSRGGKPRPTHTAARDSKMTFNALAEFFGLAARAEAEGKTTLDLGVLSPREPEASDPDPEPSPTAPAETKADDETARLRARVAELEAAAASGPDTAAVIAAAESRVAALAGKLTPEAAEALVKVQVAATLADLDDGGSRLADLGAFLGLLPDHGLFSERAVDEGDRLVPLTAEEPADDGPLMEAFDRRFAGK